MGALVVKGLRIRDSLGPVYSPHILKVYSEFCQTSKMERNGSILYAWQSSEYASAYNKLRYVKMTNNLSPLWG